MSATTKPTHELPGGRIQKDKTDDGVVNDSLGTIDPADTTGIDEKSDSGSAKDGSRERPRED